MSHSIDPALTPPVAMPYAAPAQEPAFVGRERDLALLRGQLDATLAGRGGLVLISGGAGLGKTTLAESVAGEAVARGALVLTGRCYDLTETPPYGPWLELARRYPTADPDLPPLPPVFAQSGGIGESASQEALFATIQGFLVEVTARRPVLLLLDDLHWSDPASLDLLRRLGREVGQLRLLLVA